MYSLGRGRMYSTTKSNSPFCGAYNRILQIVSTAMISLGYHYFVELVLDRDMAKTGGELYVGIFSNYELLANVSMTAK